MDNNQMNDIKNWMQNISNLNIDEVVSLIFITQDVNNINVGHFTVAEYVSTIKRVIRQFEEEFEENGKYLPLQYNYQNEYGSGSIDNDIQNLFNYLNGKTVNHLNKSVGCINRMIYYQIVNGFWDKSSRKIHRTSEIKTVELNDQLNYIAKQLKENSESFNGLINNFNNEKKQFEEFIIQKKQELKQIENNLQTTNTNTNQIAQLLNVSTSTNEKINGVLNQQNSNLKNQKIKSDELDKIFEVLAERFKDFETTIQEKIKTFESQITSFNNHLGFVEEKKVFFEERNTYLNELIGREVGASLFETFKQRKIELEKPVSKWLWIVIFMAALTFIAIIIIFTNGFGYFGVNESEISVIRLITNSIKTLPFFFLLFYSISQYNKERSFQEEYAFKSAVALTIKAYSDIIKKDDLKDELIVNSVSSIYKSPTINKTRKTKEENTLLETARELLGTALDVMKKK